MTIFLDIDGCLFKHDKPTSIQAMNYDEPEVLPGVLDKLILWEKHKIILTTGRKECYREFTIWQLERAGIMYDQLIMDVGTDARILINDNKPNEPEPKAQSVNIARNEGIGVIELTQHKHS